MPMLLLAFDGAVASVPTAVIHCFRLTVVALQQAQKQQSSSFSEH